MSRAATDWAWSLTIKPATSKLILLAMADRADEEHCCFPSIDRLVSDTSLDKKTVKAGIAKLMEAGVILDTGRRRGKTQRVRVFQLNLTKNGPIKPDQKRDDYGDGNEPKNGPLNEPKNGSQNQSVEPVKETPPATGVYPDEFEACWAAYPKRLGSHSKKAAFKKWNARVNEGVATETLILCARRYADYCDAEGTLGTRYVKMAATFFGPDEHWREYAGSAQVHRMEDHRQPFSPDDCAGTVYIPTPANGGAE